MSKAYVFTRFGGPEVEALVDQDPPEPGPGQLLVAVRAAGVNPVDWKLRAGKRRPGAPPAEFPEVLGSEVAGVVEAVGSEVEGFTVGDAVFGNPDTGGYAEYTLLPASLAAHKPEGLTFAEAAALLAALRGGWGPPTAGAWGAPGGRDRAGEKERTGRWSRWYVSDHGTYRRERDSRGLRQLLQG